MVKPTTARPFYQEASTSLLSLSIRGQFSSVQSRGHVRLFATPWTVARQASLSITNSQSSLRFMSIESVMPSSHLILSCPLLLLPPIPPSIKVFSNESTLPMRWPKYWNFSFSINGLAQNCERSTSRLYVVTLLILLLCRVHHVKCQSGWSTSYNQDCQEKYQ